MIPLQHLFSNFWNISLTVLVKFGDPDDKIELRWYWVIITNALLWDKH